MLVNDFVQHSETAPRQEEKNQMVRLPAGEGEQAVEHVETMFPLWCQQKELLKLLNEERQARHREMKNSARMR